MCLLTLGFLLHTSLTPVLEQIYCLSHIITYDRQNICRESHDASYCRKYKTLLYSKHLYMSEWSDDEFKSAETCSNSSFFIYCILHHSTTLVTKKYRAWHWYKCILTAFFHSTSILVHYEYKLADEGNAQQ
jgi:hypothetical protein